MPQHVVVTQYRPEWASLYEAEAEKIRSILKNNLFDIYHIGSTAVPGLAAKPIIDIMPVVFDIAKTDTLKMQFDAIGYEWMGEFGIPGRRYLRKGGDERTHQVHIFEKSNEKDIARHLAVRDYLRTHPDVAAAYGAMKQKLADKFPFDIESYCDGKDAFVKRLEQDALLWYQSLPSK